MYYVKEVIFLEEFKKGVDNAMPFVMLISVLLVNILLVTGIMKLFFGWDSAILAGVIAFIGAIIGGSITLIGVNKTIHENRKEEELKTIITNLKYIEELDYKLYGLFDSLHYPLVDFTRARKMTELKKIRNKVTSLSNSPEVFVLGNRVNKSIHDLGSLVAEYELIVMVKDSVEEDIFKEIQYQVASCFGVMDIQRDELRLEYERLKAS